MADAARQVCEIAGVAPDAIPFEALIEAQQPAILKGLAADWPLVRKGRTSPAAAIPYLQSFHQGRPVTVYRGAPEIGGRFFYDETVTALNFEARRQGLDEFLDGIAAHLDDPAPPAFYIGSTDVDAWFPGLRAANGLILNHDMFERSPPLVGIWIGNRTVAATHYDMSYNLACSLVGRRRFTLFPPDQVGNLYPGPLEPTPGGQVVSMVDARAPDLDLYPRFREAQAAAQVAALEPGDVLFYPALWWHQVEALEPFNVMINYWWNLAPGFMDSPQNTLLHALLSLRDRPEPEKRAWRELFDFYVFGPADQAGAHLPEAARGNLGPLDALKARRLRGQLLNRLNR